MSKWDNRAKQNFTWNEWISDGHEDSAQDAHCGAC
jgi:hypothetical protein